MAERKSIPASEIQRVSDKTEVPSGLKKSLMVIVEEHNADDSFHSETTSAQNVCHGASSSRHLMQVSKSHMYFSRSSRQADPPKAPNERCQIWTSAFAVKPQFNLLCLSPLYHINLRHQSRPSTSPND